MSQGAETAALETAGCGSADALSGRTARAAGDARRHVARRPEFLVNTYTTSGQSAPSLAMDSAGDFVAVWSSYGQDGSGSGIYASVSTPQQSRRATNSALTRTRRGTKPSPTLRWTPMAISS